MRFFVPAASDFQDGEALYQRIRARVAQFKPTDRRIYKVKFADGDKVETLAVGNSFRQLGDEPVLAIVEANNHWLICTTNHGALKGEPFRIPRDAALDVEEFTALA
jgi:hypothetical protein